MESTLMPWSSEFAKLSMLTSFPSESFTVGTSTGTWLLAHAHMNAVLLSAEVKFISASAVSSSFTTWCVSMAVGRNDRHIA
eukprot:6189043-Pleurochrysis_carterae.AAC.2